MIFEHFNECKHNNFPVYYIVRTFIKMFKYRISKQSYYITLFLILFIITESMSRQFKENRGVTKTAAYNSFPMYHTVY